MPLINNFEGRHTHIHTHTHTHTNTHAHTQTCTLASWTKAILRNQVLTSSLKGIYLLKTNGHLHYFQNFINTSYRILVVVASNNYIYSYIFCDCVIKSSQDETQNKIYFNLLP